MSPDKIIVIVAGIAAIAFVHWFFLAKKRTRAHAAGAITITVEGGYTPEVITIPQGKKTAITFKRVDPNACLEEVVLGDFGVRKYLPLNAETTVEIMPTRKGEFTYSCGMNMYHGTIIVE